MINAIKAVYAGVNGAVALSYVFLFVGVSPGTRHNRLCKVPGNVLQVARVAILGVQTGTNARRQGREERIE